jgi:predicted RNA-binding Zn-ribbon protein involved in translation (DUF1610 family)
MKGSPRFFCENCGAEVPRDAKRCPQCGRSFASVRCPACDFVGAEYLFAGGCPVCGYSAPGGNASGPPPKAAPPPSRREAAGALPRWVYVLTGLALLGILVLLFFFLR